MATSSRGLESTSGKIDGEWFCDCKRRCNGEKTRCTQRVWRSHSAFRREDADAAIASAFDQFQAPMQQLEGMFHDDVSLCSNFGSPTVQNIKSNLRYRASPPAPVLDLVIGVVLTLIKAIKEMTHAGTRTRPARKRLQTNRVESKRHGKGSSSSWKTNGADFTRKNKWLATNDISESLLNSKDPKIS